MSFIRIKKIKKIEYAYFVENKWTKTGSRQKVGKYLGKLYRLEKDKERDFADILKEPIDEYINTATPKEIIHDLIRFELTSHGFKKSNNNMTTSQEVFKSNSLDISINLSTNTITNQKDKPVVLFINDGYFCSNTVSELLNFNYKGTQKEVGTQLANIFLNSGVNIPQELFILFFHKVYNADVTKIN